MSFGQFLDKKVLLESITLIFVFLRLYLVFKVELLDQYLDQILIKLMSEIFLKLVVLGRSWLT